MARVSQQVRRELKLRPSESIAGKVIGSVIGMILNAATKTVGVLIVLELWHVI